MKQPLHENIAKAINPEMMMWVLDDSLDQTSAVALCKACSIIIEKKDKVNVQKVRLIMDLVEAFYKNEKNALKIAEALEAANRDVVKDCREDTIPHITTLVADRDRLIREKKPGRILYALATDGRMEVNRSAQTLLKSLEDKKTAPNLTEVCLKARIDELAQRNDKLEREIESWHERLEVVEAEKRKQADDLKKANAVQQNTESPDATSVSIKQLARENRRIQGSLEKLEKKLEAFPQSKESPDRFVEALSETVVEIKSLVTREIIETGRERNEVKKAMEDLREAVRVLPSAIQNFVETGKRPRRLDGDGERVGIFVDVQNIFYAAKQFNARLDFEKILRSATEKRRLIRAIAYVVQSPEVDQSGFITMLQQKSYEVKRKNLRLRSDGSAKGDWDMGMAIDIMDLAEKLDVVVLVSGDGDFVSLVNLVKTIGPKVEVYSFLHNTARDLSQAADKYFPIDENLLLRVNGDLVPARSQKGPSESNKGCEMPSSSGTAQPATDVSRATELEGTQGGVSDSGTAQDSDEAPASKASPG